MGERPAVDILPAVPAANGEQHAVALGRDDDRAHRPGDLSLTHQHCRGSLGILLIQQNVSAGLFQHGPAIARETQPTPQDNPTAVLAQQR
ncbi:hypothetical protein ACFVT1_31490 [Streptomyces sp. NPDC057963]|uniref:hypothetical protein n=1 Tax=Streptomyces sp. NPDC057963 TaxID=3346290 RepID=UPI0036ED0E4C